jgi:hypothetical protein
MEADMNHELSMPGLRLLASLGIGIGSASAEPFPIVEPYQVMVVVAPHVVRSAEVAPPPIVREHTIVVSRADYVSAQVGTADAVALCDGRLVRPADAEVPRSPRGLGFYINCFDNRLIALV